MHRITYQHIANEARRIQQITRRDNNDANWLEAIETLKIFPNQIYDLRGIRTTNLASIGDALTDSCFGFLITHYNPYGSAPQPDGLRMYWHSCRETFEKDILGEPSAWTRPVDHGNFRYAFFIQPFNGQEYRVPHFIRDIELNRLHLSELTTFMRVQGDVFTRPVILVRPSSFWTCCSMRFSLMTVLFRAGRFYFYNTIEDALMSYDYSRTTFAAINLFFQGRRNYVGPPLTMWQRKWVYNFNNLHESQVTLLAA